MLTVIRKISSKHRIL